MANELLPYFEKELAFIRLMGAEFAKEHPKIAGRLGLNSENIEDPHVSRLMEGFAYLNSRIQHKLHDDFPELTDALLNIVYPHYQRPIPSMGIVQFTPDPDQLDSKFRIEQGTLIETEHFQGEHCRFTLKQDVDLYPIEIASAQLMGKPFTTPGAGSMRSANSVIKLSLQTFSPDITFKEIGLDGLKVYLKGQSQYVHPLYRMLLNECLGIVLSAPDQSSKPVYVDPSQLKSVGFTPEEGLLKYPPNSFIGYRLLTEFFVFPEKFMFVNFDAIGTKLPDDTESKLDIYIYLTSEDVELEHNINASYFQLGCGAAINLFEQQSDPIKLDHTQLEYQVVPDARRPKGYEVYSVNNVIASKSDGDKKEYLPFYGLKHPQMDNSDHAFWYAARRSAKLGYQERDDATDVFLTLVDLGFNPNLPDDRTLTLDLTCSNRDQPGKLPYNSEHPKLQCVTAAPPCTKIRFSTQPTKTVRPPPW